MNKQAPHLTRLAKMLERGNFIHLTDNIIYDHIKCLPLHTYVDVRTKACDLKECKQLTNQQKEKKKEKRKISFDNSWHFS